MASDSPDWTGIAGAMRYLGVLNVQGAANPSGDFPYTPAEYDQAIVVYPVAIASIGWTDILTQNISVDLGAMFGARDLQHADLTTGQPFVALTSAAIGPNWKVHVQILGAGFLNYDFHIFAVPSFPIALLVSGTDPLRVQGTVKLDPTAAVVTLAANPQPVSGSVSIAGPVDTELPAAVALSDTLANPTAPIVGAASLLWDGAEWIRQQTSVAAAWLASAARTATVASAPIQNAGWRGVKLLINVTAIGTGNITPRMYAVYPGIGNMNKLIGNAISANGIYELTIFPEIASLAGVSLNDVCPPVVLFQVVHNNANPVTYAATYAFLF